MKKMELCLYIESVTTFSIFVLFIYSYSRNLIVHKLTYLRGRNTLQYLVQNGQFFGRVFILIEICLDEQLNNDYHKQSSFTHPCDPVY